MPPITQLVFMVVALSASSYSPLAVDSVDSLDLVLDGAKDVKRRAGDIRYLLSEPYPATSAIKEITLRFERSGWTQLSKDPLDPVGHGEHLRTWAAAPIAPDQLGKVWIGWFGNEGNLAMVMLMYGEPETPKAVADELEVVIRRLTKDDL